VGGSEPLEAVARRFLGTPYAGGLLPDGSRKPATGLVCLRAEVADREARSLTLTYGAA
jgi:hypothetical protein